jgi:hypothetical protein
MTRVTLASTATDAGNHPLALPKSAPGGVLFLPALVSAALSHHNVVELAKATSLQLLRLPTPLTVDAFPAASWSRLTWHSHRHEHLCSRILPTPTKNYTSSITVFFAIRRVRNNHQPDIAEFCCVSPKGGNLSPAACAANYAGCISQESISPDAQGKRTVASIDLAEFCLCFSERQELLHSCLHNYNTAVAQLRTT